MSKRRIRDAKKPNTTSKKASAMDAFSNPIYRLGFGSLDPLQASEYPITRLSQNYNLLTSLYRDNWIVQNIVTTIPQDIVRKWYTLTSGIAPEYADALTKLERQTQLRSRLLEGMYWGRLYGGAAGIILIKGQDNLSEPLDLDSIMPGSFLGLNILDRWSGIYPESELVTDPGDTDYGLPKYYTIRDEETGATVMRVHHSRIIRFIGRKLPWLEAVTELYWGESEIESIYNEIVRRDNIAANMAALTFRANITYMEMDGLEQMLGSSNAQVQRRFWQVMQAQSVMESNFGTRVVDKGTAMHNTQYTFAGLSDVYDRVMMDVAGAARTPVTKLFGRSPAGLNATGESDLRNYYDYIDSLRENELRPILDRLLPIMALSAWGVIPDDLSFDFPPMSTPDAAEVANVTERKTGAIISAYQSNLIDKGTALKELNALSDEVGIFGKITDEEIEEAKGVTYTNTQLMNDPLSGLNGEETSEVL